jgi:hypothetical protein
VQRQDVSGQRRKKGSIEEKTRQTREKRTVNEKGALTPFS